MSERSQSALAKHSLFTIHHSPAFPHASMGGYSGHGIMLSNFFGKLYAETVAGNRDRLKLIEDLKIPAFPGGRRLRAPLLFLALNWFALRRRI